MTTSAARFLDLVNREILAVQDFIQLLQDEQKHLIAADTDGLTVATDRKTAAIRHLAELSASRTAFFMASHIAATPEGVQSWLQQQTDEASQAWSMLMKLAEQAREQNRLNGMLIARHMSSNQAALTVLTGSSAGGSFYGPNGQSTTPGSTRTFAAS